MPLNLRDLKDYFLSGIKPIDDQKIGVEWEKIGVYKESGKAIRYSGPRGVKVIFQSLVKQFKWKPVYSGSDIIALQKKQSSITLEPGGQIELSGRKARFLNENAEELYAHLMEIKTVSDPMGIAWLGIGLQPISGLSEIEWVPKKRYEIMKKSLRRRGALTYAMMKQTASIQVSLDYTGEKDAIQKLRLAFGLTPIFVALFANSPVARGKLNGFLSQRSHIWSQTAPERTGTVPNIWDPDFGFDSYRDYALSTPLLFIVRDNQWIPTPRMTFRDFLKNGFGRLTPTLKDWELHLTTIFTEARLKKYIEIRSVDCQRKVLGLSVPAFIKGIFYDRQSRESAWGLVCNLSKKERERLLKEARVKGLRTPFGKKTLLEAGETLFLLSEQGLKRLVAQNLSREGEGLYLKPLEDLLFKREMTPAEILISCWKENRSKREKLKKLLSCAAI